MDFAIQVCSYLVGLPLELLTIAAMLRGGYKRYPLVFTYVIIFFLTTVVEMPSAVAFYQNKADPVLADNYTWWYFRDEAVLQLLIFAVVISFIYEASSKLASRRLVRLGLVSGAVLFVGVSFVIHYHPVPNISWGVWFTAWISNVKFCAAILDLALWALLIGSREKDQRLLLLTCGLGLMFAGEAIGESLRNLSSIHRSHLIADIGGILVLVSNMAFLYVWWRAFKAPRPPAAPKTAGVY